MERKEVILIQPTFTELTGSLLDLTSETTGASTKLFAPTAARCSSSSSTCCYGCVRIRR